MNTSSRYPFATLLSSPSDIAKAAYVAIIHCIAMLLYSMQRIPETFSPQTETLPDGTAVLHIPARKATSTGVLHLANGRKAEPLEYTLTIRPGDTPAVSIDYRWYRRKYTIRASDVPYDTLASLALDMYLHLEGKQPDEPKAHKTWSCDVILPLSLHLEGISGEDACEAGARARDIALHTDFCDWGDDFSHAEVCNLEADNA